jgi:hypothetical protein
VSLEAQEPGPVSPTSTAPAGTPPRSAAPRGRIRAPREFAAGASLIAIAVFALYASAELDTGTLGNVGAGMLPRSIAVLLGLFGLGFVIVSLVRDGGAMERWSLRGPLLVTLGVVGFAITIRPIGLALAGPLVVLVGGSASPDVRIKELVIFAIVATAFSIALFRYALGLPIPILSIGSVHI